MTDNQAGWVVVPREPTQEMIEACRSGLLGELGKALVDKQSTAAYRAMLAASPRYEPGDAVEVAAKIMTDGFGSIPFLDRMRAALTAAFPELLARIEALEREVLHWKQLYADHDCEQLQAEVDRLRKGESNG